MSSYGLCEPVDRSIRTQDCLNRPVDRPTDRSTGSLRRGATDRPTEKDESMDMTLSEAADFLDIPQKRLYRAVKSGKLNATKRHQGGRWEYLVARDDLEEFARETDRPVDQDTELSRPTGRPTQRPVDQVPTDRSTDRPTDRPVADPTDRPIENPPVELYLALVDRLQRAERRTVELELTLRQSQRLLTENAESITEKEALVLESQAKIEAIEQAKQAERDRLTAALDEQAELQKVEAARLTTELESVRQSLAEAQRPKGFLSWLGLRRSRTDEGRADKAV